MALSIEELGLTREQLCKMVVDRLTDRIMGEPYVDEDGEEIVTPTPWGAEITRYAKKAIDERINAIATEHVLPRVTELVDGICLQETNKWGEKTGKSLTFTEYLVERAEAWVTEQVNSNGKAKREDSYSWSAAQTRIAYMIHEHLQYNIKNAIESALKNFNSQVAKGLSDTVAIQLRDVLAKLKVDVKV